MHIERIDTEKEMEALVPDWIGLWQRVPGATPFQSPHWLLPWWRQFGTGMPRIFTARAEQRLTGVLPLYELHEPGCVKLLPIGISVSDYIDALADPAYPDVTDVLIAASCDIPGWQECHLPDLPPDSALSRAAAPSGLAETRQSGPCCPVLALPSDPADLATVVPRKTLRDVRQAHARSETVGSVVLDTADLDTIDLALDDLFRLHQERWHKRGEAGVLADPVVRAFHRDAARAFCEAGILRLYRLQIGGTVVGVYYGFQHGGNAYAYLGGFDPEMTRLSPGAQLLDHAIRAALAEGVREFHFLRGGESYKYAWGAVDRLNISRTFRRL
jgi:CelD/BcsL family acetyltransferase involved in cellulose biosynthesis